MTRKCVVLIPALEPSEILAEYAETLSAHGFTVVAVNDGSGEKYDAIFESVKNTRLSEYSTIIFESIKESRF